MQIQIFFHLPQPLVLPLAYHHQLQSFIYRLFHNHPQYSEFLHDTGYQDNGRRYRLFVFSLLSGRHRVQGRSITFYDEVHFEIRSPLEKITSFLSDSLIHNRKELELHHQVLQLDHFTVSDKRLTGKAYTIRMLSPVTLSLSMPQESSVKTRYLSPLDNDFNDWLNENLRHKLAAASHVCPVPSVENHTVLLTPLRVTSKDKYVTTFKNIYITGWRGSYRLTGDPDILTFLYNAGLGARNSLGFGMFEPDSPHSGISGSSNGVP